MIVDNEVEIEHIWVEYEGRRGTVWVKVPGLRRSIQFDWPGRDGAPASICCHPHWNRLSTSEQTDLAVGIWTAIRCDPRYRRQVEERREVNAP